MMYLGAWRKGEFGLEADSWQHGTRQETFVIARRANIFLLLKAIKELYPEEFAAFEKANHSDRMPKFKFKHADRVFGPYLSHGSGGVDHLVTVKDDRWTCTCLAYSFGNVCWAMRQAQKEASSGRKPLDSDS